MDEKIFNEQEFLDKVEQAAMEGAKKGTKSSLGGDLVKTLITRVVLPMLAIMAIMNVFLPRISPKAFFENLFSTEAPVEDHDLTLENHGIFGYTVTDFQEAILSDRTKLKKLEVLSYKVSDAVTITDAGLGGLKIFSKSQVITYNGTAVYTIDLSGMDKQHVTLDEENKKVVMTIPHSVLEPINIQASDMEISDTEKGFLAFGQVKMTVEQMNTIQQAAQERMVHKLVDENIVAEADRFGKMAVWEIYQPIVQSVSSGYTLEVVFED